MLMTFKPRFKIVLVLAALLPAIAITVFLGAGRSHGAIRTATSERENPTAPPTATDFSAELVGVSNKYAREHGDSTRMGTADCVEAAPGRYMCSYAVEKQGAPRTCHLIQARWTPDGASSFTITLAGRTGKCRSLREAIRTLR